MAGIVTTITGNGSTVFSGDGVLAKSRKWRPISRKKAHCPVLGQPPMKMEIDMGLVVTIMPAAVLLLAGATCSQAQNLFSTSFESPGYALGALTGQDQWYAHNSLNAGNPQVQNRVVRSGSQAVTVNASDALGYSRQALTYNDSGSNKVVEGSISMNMGTLGSSWTGLCFSVAGEPQLVVGCLQVSSFGFPYLSSFAALPLVGRTALTTGVWHDFRLSLDFAHQTVSGWVNGALIGTLLFRSPIHNLGAVGFGFNALPGSNVAHFDDLSVISSQAGSLFSDGFDSPGYSLGALTSQNLWYTISGANAGNPQVQNRVVRSGNQAVSVNASGAEGFSLHALTYNDSGASKVVEGSVYINMETLGSSWIGQCFIAGAAPYPVLGCLSVSTFGFPFITNGLRSIVGETALRAGVWNHLRLSLDFAAQTMSGYVNVRSIGTIPFPSSAHNLGAVGFGFNGIPGPNVAYFDDIAVSVSPVGVAPALRSSQPLLQSFSGTPGLSSGTWVELYGTNLAATTREWNCNDFTANCTQAPISIDGVSVNINSKPAFVRYVSPTQVNVQVPDDGVTGPAPITITNAFGTSAPITMNRTAQSPALLTTPSFNAGGKQYVAALYPDNVTFVGRTGLIPGVPFRPARPGDAIVIYAVGCGPTNPAHPAGTVVAAPLPVAGAVQVMFGQTMAQAQAFVSGLGLCQFNVTVPNLPSGDISIDASVNGSATGQTLFTTIQ
jgi:uncharacterized protein (TIGR03437 family)